jgi:hypothetical protein
MTRGIAGKKRGRGDQLRAPARRQGHPVRLAWGTSSFGGLQSSAGYLGLVGTQPLNSKRVHVVERYLAGGGGENTLDDRGVRSVFTLFITLVGARIFYREQASRLREGVSA